MKVAMTDHLIGKPPDGAIRPDVEPAVLPVYHGQLEAMATTDREGRGITINRHKPSDFGLGNGPSTDHDLLGFHRKPSDNIYRKEDAHGDAYDMGGHGISTTPMNDNTVYIAPKNAVGKDRLGLPCGDTDGELFCNQKTWVGLDSPSIFHKDFQK